LHLYTVLPQGEEEMQTGHMSRGHYLGYMTEDRVGDEGDGRRALGRVRVAHGAQQAVHLL
jgi:hypothetical protein